MIVHPHHFHFGAIAQTVLLSLTQPISSRQNTLFQNQLSHYTLLKASQGAFKEKLTWSPLYNMYIFIYRLSVEKITFFSKKKLAWEGL